MWSAVSISTARSEILRRRNQLPYCCARSSSGSFCRPERRKIARRRRSLYLDYSTDRWAPTTNKGQLRPDNTKKVFHHRLRLRLPSSSLSPIRDIFLVFASMAILPRFLEAPSSPREGSSVERHKKISKIWTQGAYIERGERICVFCSYWGKARCGGGDVRKRLRRKLSWIWGKKEMRGN